MKKDNTQDNELWRKEFARRLNLAMANRHINKTDLAKLTNIGKSDITNYTKGAYLPKQNRIFLLALVLGCNPVWLYALDVKYAIEANLRVEEPKETIEFINMNDVVPLSQFDFGSSAIDLTGDGSIDKMVHGMEKIAPEERLRLLNVAELMFPDAFREEDT